MDSKKNLELKHYCDDFPQIRKILTKLGATKEIIKKQKDFFFNLPQNQKNKKARLKLRIENKRMFLIYYERPNFIANKETKADIGLLETNKETLAFLKKSLGVQGIVDKKREVWRKNNTVFHLDTVKKVGKIFEIELQKENKITENDKKIFSNYQKEFKPFLGKVIKGSNINLVLKEN